MLYKPGEGRLWDPSVIWYEGKYFMFAMYRFPKGEDRNMWVATSVDGVHWEDVGTVISAQPFLVYKMFVAKCGNRFIMNHGSFSDRPGHTNDTLKFWQSKDLIKWTYLGKEMDTHPDPRWYKEEGRWDHMYCIPKQGGRGYWGYCVAVPREDYPHRLCGMQQSEDGIHWETLPPPVLEMGDYPPLWFEVGGCERIRDKYYLIGGTAGYMGNWGYSVFTMVADNPLGPFRPDEKAFRLCGSSGSQGKQGVQWLASFCRGNDELLISNYVTAPSENGEKNLIDTTDDIWFTPFKKAIVDQEGHLRMGYWRNNESLKGTEIRLDIGRYQQLYPTHVGKETGTKASPEAFSGSKQKKAVTSILQSGIELESGYTSERSRQDDHSIVFLEPSFDYQNGIVFEGTISIAEHEDPYKRFRPKKAGFVIEEGQGKGTAVLMEAAHPRARTTQIGDLRWNDEICFDVLDVTGYGCATVSGLDMGGNHTFRLLLRRGMFELYIDDLLLQTFLFNNAPTGRIGLIVQNAKCRFDNLKAWTMSL